MERPKISQMVINEFTKLIDSQDGKGFEKYGVSIDDAKDESYNWEHMALEEAADLQKYLVKRILELEKQLVLHDKCVQDLCAAEMSNQWLLSQLLDAKEKMKHLKEMSRTSKCMKLEQENLALAHENQKLKEQLQQRIAR
ncbi:hypothetical protein [Neobacillus drentensis]|uniref:hypothetical protein n=1 Tax=Neobacillus drentensis TaxID=220684 RepID=UPI0030009DD1